MILIKIKDYLIETTIASNTKKHYESVGIMDKRGTKIQISPDLLPLNSHVLEKRICDNCGETFEKTHQLMLKSNELFGGEDICPKCALKIAQEKREKTNLEKYGVTIPSKNKDVIKKMKETNMSKYGKPYTTMVDEVIKKKEETFIRNYGVDNPFKLQEVQDKVKETNTEKYGVDCIFKLNEFREYTKTVCLEKYRVENPQQSELIREKTKQTNLKKYGYEFTSQVPEIRKKMQEALLKSGNIETSKEQVLLKKQVDRLYLPMSFQTQMNDICSYFSLDIALFSPDGIKIDIEYDGSYWHSTEKQKKKDANRDKLVLREGYKILRVKSGTNIPSDEQIQNAIDKLLKTDSYYEEIILEDWIKYQEKLLKQQNK